MPSSKEHQRNWRTSHKEHLREYGKRYYAENRERIAVKAAESHRRSMRTARYNLIQSMGGACMVCGNTDIRVLEIDHTYGGGNAHRKSKGTGAGGYTVGYYKSLLAMYTEDPKSLSLLCANCHAIKHWSERNE
jgi:predicted HNH restriction endonuclease